MPRKSAQFWKTFPQTDAMVAQVESVPKISLVMFFQHYAIWKS